MHPGTDAPLMLSVSGARGIVGSTMTPHVARRFAHAFASIIAEQPANGPRRAVVGRDTRPSGADLAHAAACGLYDAGFDVVDLGVVMTPTVGVMVEHLDANLGMVITASHNPGEWNGMKCLGPDGSAPAAALARHIIDRFHSAPSASDTAPADLPIKRDDQGNRVHIGRVLKLIDAERIRARSFRIVLDSINGAGCVAGRELLEQLGCEVIHINGEPDGAFAHTPEPVAENLTDLAATVAREGAHVGLAQDPDGDRLAIVDETGRFIGEEYTLALCTLRALQRNQRHEPVLAANLSTSRLIDDVAASFPGAQVVRTAVGEANVVAALKNHGDHALIGGEGNGGVIVPAICWVRDSLSSIGLVLELLAEQNSTLSDIVSTLPRYAMIKRKFDLGDIGGSEAIALLLDRARRAFPADAIDDTDGVRVDLDDGWVHLRPSNTEPIIRIIAEAGTEGRARSLIAQVETLLKPS